MQLFISIMTLKLFGITIAWNQKYFKYVARYFKRLFPFLRFCLKTKEVTYNC